ncbi:acyl transferase domain-containing protein/thioesterase domain-containing protein/RNA-binding protein YhbY [Paenibacillus sp. DS2363]|uniref:SDR family NAD(P)-dependent oxidoreductase n=1 Tax=unclassified Paenibacillus TaxID=185978 RepID=UPI0030FA7B52
MKDDLYQIYNDIRTRKLNPQDAANQLTSLMAQNQHTQTSCESQKSGNTLQADTELHEKTRRMLTKAVADQLKVRPEEIEADVELSEYGFDSIMLTELSNSLNKNYRLNLTPAVFFEHSTLAQFTDYALETYVDQFAELWTSPAEARDVQKTHISSESTMKNRFKSSENFEMAHHYENAETSENAGTSVNDESFHQAQENAKHGNSRLMRDTNPRSQESNSPTFQRADKAITTFEPVAIVGMTGRFPMAKDTDVLWENLSEGRDCITEIPLSRWDWKSIYGDPLKESNKTNIKWGGFIDGVDEFDPSFFGISPREAELMDPQQRLLMLYVWKTIEDAGYAAQSLSGSNLGIFVGTSGTGYSSLISRSGMAIEGYSSTGIVPSVGPNRMSYFLNVHGPSEPIETACSSSLVAIHRAVTAMRNGDCDAAIVGGINTILTPEGHISFNRAGMLSEDGRCKTFSEQANGYVRGEGVGMLMLKRVKDAEQAGDHIYGLIRGTSQNHGGRANSLTAPNPKAQADLLIQAYRKADIDPRTVGYIETHGTGTPLGDPIEVNGLKAAFKELARQSGDEPLGTPHCGLGSVKSHIGHLEMAAGVAGVMKVLLQMKHRKLVPGLHLDHINPYVQLDNSPFYIVQETREWAAPRDSDGREMPRRAGVSSFGFGGVNAHIILEEYIPNRENHEKNTTAIPGQHPAIVVLSARNEARLREQVNLLLQALREGKYAENDLANMAYTLQIGREPMEERLALIVGTMAELETGLTHYMHEGAVTGHDGIETYRGQAKRKDTLLSLTEDEEMQDLVHKWYLRGKLGKVAEIWTRGFIVQWSALYDGKKPDRISLPTYPFAQEKYWVPIPDSRMPRPFEDEYSNLAGVLHPLVHSNISNLYSQRYSSIFTGTESFLQTSVTSGKRTFPDVACMEMARVAAQHAMESSDGDGQSVMKLRLSDVKWVQHDTNILNTEFPLQIQIEIYPEEDQKELFFEISSAGNNKGRQLLTTGRVSRPERSAYDLTRFDLQAVRNRCELDSNSATSDADNAWSGGQTTGRVKQSYKGNGEVLLHISSSEETTRSTNMFIDPKMLQDVIQVGLCELCGQQSQVNLGGAFTIKSVHSLEVLQDGQPVWVWIRLGTAPHHDSTGAVRSDLRLDVAIANDAGQVLVWMEQVTVSVPEVEGVILLEPYWETAPNRMSSSVLVSYSEHRIILCGELKNFTMTEMLKQGMPGVSLIQLGSAGTLAQRYEAYVLALLEQFKDGESLRHEGSKFIQVVIPDDAEQSRLWTGLSGLLRTVQLEHPQVRCQLVEMQRDTSLEQWVERLKSCANLPNEDHLRYMENQLYRASWKELVQDVSTEAVSSIGECSNREGHEHLPSHPWQDGGVYVITGGGGGLGPIFAQEIALKATGTTIILTGRSPALPTAVRQRIQELPAHIQYLTMDVADEENVQTVLAMVRHTYGKVNGILHGAGITRDRLLENKTGAECREVLASKVAGTVYLDEATRRDDLDVLILFSSGTGVTGNIGQADYAAANAFMDRYAAYRNTLVQRGERTGQTLSVNWPLWESGGMQINEQQLRNLKKQTGMHPLREEEGTAALYQALASGRSQVLVAAGEVTRLRQKFLSSPDALDSRNAGQPAIPEEQTDTAWLEHKVRETMASMISSLLKVQVTQIDPEVELGEYGLDSIMLTELTNTLNENFNMSLTPALFFEYSTLQAFSQYVTRTYQQQFLTRFSSKMVPTQAKSGTERAEPLVFRRFTSKHASDVGRVKPTNVMEDQGIAIVGMSGIFPMAADPEELWDNLAAQRDCITEIPRSRREKYAYQKDSLNETGELDMIWGGFIEGVDQFDPGFFGISPREAELMDPQQRLLMLYVWKAIEDAGYAPQSLSGSKLGIFVGTAGTGYSNLIASSGMAMDSYTSTGIVPSVGPNRMSYFLNVHGPSEPIETACSSSLVAIHRAVTAMRNGDCNAAVVGGINTILTPEGYISLTKAGMLSSDGRCKTFSAQADGYVRSEGVGMLMIKPLKDAEEAGDHIYAVIRGTNENHGGRANSLTAPNPKAQTELLFEAYQKAGIDPRTVGYIETHGTGTPLGDPIEVNALKATFRNLYEHTGDSQMGEAHCGLGSVKSNIGHLEMAAGIAGVIKVLLQLKHQKLAPNLHLDEVNPYVQLEDSPFYLVRDLQEWKPITNADGKAMPRRAGVSSFGFGGSNAHVILEEYTGKSDKKEANHSAAPEYPTMIVLSARNKGELQEQVRLLLKRLQYDSYMDADLRDLAYTLQVGRNAMEERLGVLTSGIADLKEKLSAALDGGMEQLPEGLMYQAGLQGGKEALLFNMDEGTEEIVNQWLQNGSYGKVLDLWTKGYPVRWEHLYKDDQDKPSRLSLPTYPFAKEKYWVPYQSVQKFESVSPAERQQFGSESQHVPSEEATELLSFQEIWEESSHLDSDSAKLARENVRGLICLLSDKNKQSIIREMLARRSPDTEVYFVEEAGDEAGKMDREAYCQQFRMIAKQGDHIDAVLYLWPFDDAQYLRDTSPIVHMIQAMVMENIQPKRILLAGEHATALDQCYLDSWIGFERSIGLSMKKTKLTVCSSQARQNSDMLAFADLSNLLWDELLSESPQSVRFEHGRRLVSRMKQVDLTEHADEYTRYPKPGQTVLITGGLGGLGVIFAKVWASKGINLVLMGRSPLDEMNRQLLKGLGKNGSQVIYVQADVSEAAEVTTALQSAKMQCGDIHGWVHAAGMESQETLLSKSIKEFERVLRPKVKGLLVMDEALQNEPLAFRCYFSSSSALLGDFGSCDYAVANRFQMAYAQMQDQNIRTIAILWPLWREGGMGSRTTEGTDMYLRTSGLRFLEKDEGIAFFDQVIRQSGTHQLALAGRPSRIHRFLGLDMPASKQSSPGLRTKARNQDQAQVRNSHSPLGKTLQECVGQELRGWAAQLLKMEATKLDPDRNLADYGFDSISLAEFAELMSQQFRLELSPTVFFAHATLNKLSQHLITSFSEEMEARYSMMSTAYPTQIQDHSHTDRNTNPSVMEQLDGSTEHPVPEPSELHREEPIAIIGMSGRFPQAGTIEDLWTNVESGSSCISRLPRSRWTSEGGKDVTDENAGIPAWGGYLADIDRFDPMFFHISPNEAAMMDPRQRLFLEEAWHALEDAGYMGDRIRGQNCGVYVGVEEGEYGYLTAEKGSINGNQNATLAARIAYVLDLKGPNMAITAACSSGLVALHQACQALRSGECDTALAGAVSLILSPMLHTALHRAGMLSPDGQCRVFDERANGMVPGEAVTALMLKPLKQAIQDGDHIYGTIRGSGVNYSGRTNGLTAPDPESQAELMKMVYKRYRIDPRSVQFIMSQSVGSPIGDAIEMQALSNVYGSYNDQDIFVAIGSVKPLIGHTFAASGLVSLITMLMAMRHRTIPALHSYEEPNRHINMGMGSNLNINKENRPWRTPLNASRMGAISTTGISGTNAHVVIEEYVAAETEQNDAVSEDSVAQVVILSALNKERLQAAAQQLLNTVILNNEMSLRDVAYTLQVGREAMPDRLALIVSHKKELITGLKKFLKAEKANKNWVDSCPMFTGRAEEDSTVKELLSGRTGEKILRAFMAEGNLDKIALYWSKGGNVSWEGLHEGKPAQIISLPGYPFEKRRCWVDLTHTLAHAKSVVVSSLEKGAPDSSIDVAGNTSLEHRITAIILNLLGLESGEIQESTPLVQYGMDSIVFIQLIQRLQTELNPEINAADLQHCLTLADIIASLTDRLNQTPMLQGKPTSFSVTGPEEKTNGSLKSVVKSWPQFPELVRLNHASEGRPVFWFHAAMGGVEGYQVIASRCTRPFYGIQARGWMTDRSPLYGIEGMAMYYVHVIKTVQPEGPYDLGGYSLGGLIAYEVCRLLQNQGDQVNSMVMLDSIYLSDEDEMTSSDKGYILQSVNMSLMSSILHQPEKIADTLIHRDEINMELSNEDFLKHLTEIAKSRGLFKNEKHLQQLIEQCVKVQQAYQADQYQVQSLADRDAVACYYFRNQSGHFFGELEPYFVTEEDCIELNNSTYWSIWAENIPNFNLFDIDVSNHMLLLSNPASSDRIGAFCKQLYSSEGVTEKDIQSFKKSTKARVPRKSSKNQIK